MDHENFEQNPFETPVEDGETSGEGAEVVEEAGKEEKVVPEIPPDEAPEGLDQFGEGGLEIGPGIIEGGEVIEGEETSGNLAREILPPQEAINEKKKTGHSLGKKIVTAAALAGTLAAGTEAMGGTRDKADKMFDELDSATEIMQKVPAKHTVKPAAPKEERKDLFDTMERVDELGHAYMNAETDSERDRYAAQIAEALITGGAHTRMEENTIHVFTATLLGTPVEVRYIILDGVARGSLTDNANTILHKTHEFQFSVR